MLLSLALALLSLQPAQAFQNLMVSPNWVDFGQTYLGQTSTYTVHVQNTGDEDIQYVSVMQLGDRMEFSLTNSCSYLPRYSSCVIWIRYSPRTEGSHRLDLNIQGGSAFTTAHIRGSGVQQPLE